MTKDSIIIYSGGMDSTVLLNENKENIGLAISFNYNGKHNDKEYEYAEANCKKLDIPLIRIDLDFIAKFFKSNLLKNQAKIPNGHYAEENMKKTVVPFRNGIMLSIATGIAESNGFKKVLIANHNGDHDVYPDCREDFIKSFCKATTLGTWEEIEVIAPFTKISKRDIAIRGKKIEVDFKNTYSCYNGDTIHCGKCGTCVERIEALNGFDPTIYKDTGFAKGILNDN